MVSRWSRANGKFADSCSTQKTWDSDLKQSAVRCAVGFQPKRRSRSFCPFVWATNERAGGDLNQQHFSAFKTCLMTITPSAIAQVFIRLVCPEEVLQRERALSQPACTDHLLPSKEQRRVSWWRVYRIAQGYLSSAMTEENAAHAVSVQLKAQIFQSASNYAVKWENLT